MLIHTTFVSWVFDGSANERMSEQVSERVSECTIERKNQPENAVVRELKMLYRDVCVRINTHTRTQWLLAQKLNRRKPCVRIQHV